MGHIRVGISGWRYAGWRGAFYPSGLTQARELEYASRRMQTIEVNGSHYALQTPSSYARWYEATPRGFVFSVKSPRYLTHILRFRDADASRKAMANFFASGLFMLKEKLGPILWQFPPSFKFDAALFESMLRLLPRNTEEAAALAREHDRHVKDTCLQPDRKRRLRHAIEVRHGSFCNDAFVAMLRKYHAAIVVSDSVKDWPYFEDLTAGFVYMRLHGTQTLYSGKYGDAALERWAARMKAWASGAEPPDARRIAASAAPKRSGRDVFCYFDNDIKAQAPDDACRLMHKLGG